MKRSSILTILFLVVFGTTAASARQSTLPPFVRDSLETYVNRAMKEYQMPGVAILIVKDGKPVVMRGYGVRALGSSDKVDENTLFMIGSNTKAFTATAMCMLANDKILSLDDKVQKWLPEFKLENPLASNEVIIRDLLCHRLGLETFQGDFCYWTSDLTRKEVMQRLGLIKAPYSFRTRWGYTNAAFLTAGEIIPKAAGKPWEEFVKESLLVPLKMERTLTLASQIVTASNAARPHTTVNGATALIPYCAIDNLAPAGSISSSVSDMSHWVMAQLDSGIYDGKRVIPWSVIQTTRVPQSILGPRAGTRFTRGHFSLYGLGWDLSEYGGKLLVGHTGGVNGFVTSVALMPEEKLGVVVFTNTDQNNFYEAVKYEILDAYLNLPYRNYDSVLYTGDKRNFDERIAWLKAKRDSIALHLPQALPLQGFTGSYHNDVYGDMSVSLDHDSLTMHFSHHTMTGRLEGLGGTRFLCTYSDPEMGIKVIPFTVENGRARSVTVRVDDFVEFTPYEFLKQ